MKVCIVEDSPVIQRILLSEIARIENVEICGMADEPDSAVKMIRESAPDLVVLDIVLNNGNGFEVLKKVRSEGSVVKILVLTNYAFQHYRIICGEMGADYFFDKSIEMGKALQTIRTLACHENLNSLITGGLQ